MAALHADVARETMHDDHRQLAIVCTFVTVNMNLGSVITVCVHSKTLFEGAYSRDYNCISKNTPPPHSWLDVVYKGGGGGGGGITGDYSNYAMNDYMNAKFWNAQWNGQW